MPGSKPKLVLAITTPQLQPLITFNSVSVHMNCRYQKKLEALDSVEVASQEMVTCLVRVVGTQLRSPTRIHAFSSEPFLRAINLLFFGEIISDIFVSRLYIQCMVCMLACLILAFSLLIFSHRR